MVRDFLTVWVLPVAILLPPVYAMLMPAPLLALTQWHMRWGMIYRRVFNPNHRSCVPNFGVYIKAEINGKMKYFAVSRQMVLFAVERRKAWRMLQSKAGVVNKDYLAQKALLKKLDGGEIALSDAQSKTRELYEAEIAGIK